MINVKDLTVRVGEHTLVDQVSFTAHAGEVTAVSYTHLTLPTKA